MLALVEGWSSQTIFRPAQGTWLPLCGVGRLFGQGHFSDLDAYLAFGYVNDSVQQFCLEFGFSELLFSSGQLLFEFFDSLVRGMSHGGYVYLPS
ncbi:hypothetical protein [Adhaeribacter soli]|uniref:hypothetical protein n=1 Tax=Adhaeribacter soli TaxID=2607655 RepID=UPI0017857F93|nr:hypothetical protein [Adhaeribacter soli]